MVATETRVERRAGVLDRKKDGGGAEASASTEARLRKRRKDADAVNNNDGANKVKASSAIRENESRDDGSSVLVDERWAPSASSSSSAEESNRDDDVSNVQHTESEAYSESQATCTGRSRDSRESGSTAITNGHTNKHGPELHVDQWAPFKGWGDCLKVAVGYGGEQALESCRDTEFKSKDDCDVDGIEEMQSKVEVMQRSMSGLRDKKMKDGTSHGDVTSLLQYKKLVGLAVAIMAVTAVITQSTMSNAHTGNYVTSLHKLESRQEESEKNAQKKVSGLRLLMKDLKTSVTDLASTAKNNESRATNNVMAEKDIADQTTKVQAENNQWQKEKTSLLEKINQLEKNVGALQETIGSLMAKIDKIEVEKIDVVAEAKAEKRAILGIDWYQYNSTKCQKPRNATKRHGNAWVHIEDYRVLKHPSNRMEYFYEKEMATRLGEHDHFNKLLGFDDDCEVLIFERLFSRHGGFERPAEHTFNRTHLRHQLESIFNTFEMEQIEPSEEFFMGLNNIFIGEEQNITMFDYHLYRWKFNSTYNSHVRDRLYNVIIESGVYKNKKQ